MKKGLILLLYISFIGSIFSQTKPPKKKKSEKIDTVKTEVVEVVSKYNAKVADANKIRKSPIIEVSDKNKRKKLSYTIYSAPVASTFTPKTGALKGIDIGLKEELHKNYLALGYGNYNSPFAELYIHKNKKFDEEYGVKAKYLASLNDIQNTELNSTFSNFLSSVFYKKDERYFNWKVSLDGEIYKYNWYGLSNNNFIASTLNSIDEKQNYTYLKAAGEIDLFDAYIDNSVLSISHFSDNFQSKEFIANLETNFDIPIDFISRQLDDLIVKTNFEYLSGEFERDYATLNKVDYSIFTANINPEYKSEFSGFSYKIGASFFASFDTENKLNNFLIYPDVLINKSISNEKFNFYTGINGNLTTNTFKSFSDKNPYVSPTLFITQTSKKYDAFLGTNGIINNELSFNISTNIKEEEDKPFFVKNNSKSDGTNTSLNGESLLGYEYGNSFNVVYDDVKTISVRAELEYELSNKISSKINFEYYNYETTNQTEAWNLPNIKGDFSLKYKTVKWYAATNIFYVGERKDLLFTSIYPSISNGIQTLDAFVDINLDGGYHFNDKFSVFLQFNNLLNQNYQRFLNFDVQGFQVLGGVTYKFDF